MNILPLLLSSLTGCVTSPDALPSTTVDRAAMPFEADGVRCEGACVLPRKSRTRITFSLPDGVREIAISTCHRETFFSNPSRAFAFDYIPTSFLENWDTCLLKATAFLKDGTTMLAVIDWTSNEMLPGTLQCNGVAVPGVKGASFCQSRAGLVQAMSFTVPVEARAPERCSQPYSESGKTADWRWFVDLSPGLCIYAFRDANGQFHRLTTYGYTESSQ